MGVLRVKTRPKLGRQAIMGGMSFMSILYATHNTQTNYVIIIIKTK